MSQSPHHLYIDLMKNTLSFTLWPEPPMPVTSAIFDQSNMKVRLAAAISNVLGRWDIQLVKRASTMDAGKADGRSWPGYADTMIGHERLNNLQECVETVLRDEIEGDLIELGVWRGGACIFMRAILAAYGVTDRKVFVADSFAGLPRPDAERYPADEGDTLHAATYLAVSRAEVENNFRRYKLLDDQVVFIQGFFEDTLPTAPIDKLAILRLDGDMYSSTIQCLEALYDKLSSGGFCIIDDYALKGCKEAVTDFRKDRGIDAAIKEIDWTGCYWRKP